MSNYDGFSSGAEMPADTAPGSAASGGFSDQSGADAQQGAIPDGYVPRQDLDRLRSTYDRQVADWQSRYQDRDSTFQQVQAELAQTREQLQAYQAYMQTGQYTHEQALAFAEAYAQQKADEITRQLQLERQAEYGRSVQERTQRTNQIAEQVSRVQERFGITDDELDAVAARVPLRGTPHEIALALVEAVTAQRSQQGATSTHQQAMQQRAGIRWPQAGAAQGPSISTEIPEEARKRPEDAADFLRARLAQLRRSGG